MTLEELILHNFGVYNGRQTIALTPPSPDQPIILVGGLNGGGKTTLLDALQLALYGKLARCSNRGSLAYSDYLRSCITRSVAPSDGGGLELAFSHVTDGTKQTYRVVRTWRQAGKAVKESLEVLRNGEYDRVLTEQWAEFMEEILPVRIAHLFFFDGEKIEGFADPSSASDLLAVAVHSLLGLDLVDQLMTDLVALERRKKVENAPEGERQEIEERAAHVDALEEQHKRYEFERAAIRTVRDKALKRLEKADEAFRSEGGHLYERRKELEDRRCAIELDLGSVEDELRELAAGPAPLLLVRSLLVDILEQSEAEAETESAELVAEILEERDTGTLEFLKSLGVEPAVLDKTEHHLVEERAARLGNAGAERYLDLSREAHGLILQLNSSALGEVHQTTERLVAHAEWLQTELDEQDRLLASIPTTDSIAALIDAREKARAEVDELDGKLREFDDQLDRVDRELAHYETRLAASLERQARAEFVRRDARRVIDHSSRSRETMQAFRKAVVERHAGRIAGFVLESFQHLLRKEGLVTGLTIDPDTFALTLHGPEGQKLSPSRLSAGERQLLAVSILWGLARASGRPLPVVIDTPMGRLDSEHRANLVDRYFRSASHQVLLLSTDEEIDESHLDKLNGSVGRSYELVYESHDKSTIVRPGYFW